MIETIVFLKTHRKSHVIGAKHSVLRPRAGVSYNLIYRTHKGFNHEH